jgi:hypothetical protein
MNTQKKQKKVYKNFVEDAPVVEPLTANGRLVQQTLTTPQPVIAWQKAGEFLGGLLGTNKANASSVYRPNVTNPNYVAPVQKQSSMLVPIVVIAVVAVGGFFAYKHFSKK